MSAFEDHHLLVEVIKAASRVKFTRERAERAAHVAPVVSPARATPLSPPYQPRRIILMGASTGGTEALRAILTRLPGNLPGICIVQHIPAHFSLAFAQRLNELCALEVREAKNGDVVAPGLALVAPGGFSYCTGLARQRLRGAPERGTQDPLPKTRRGRPLWLGR